MDDFLPKLIIPILLSIVYLLYAVKNKVKGGIYGLTVAIYPSVSSNFSTPIYRFIGQLLLILCIMNALLTIVLRKKYSVIYSPFVKYISIYILFVLLSIYGNPLDTHAFKVELYNLLFGVFATAAFSVGVSDDKKLINIVKVLRLQSILLSITTIVQNALMGIDRVEAPFSNPNYLAFFIGIGIVCHLYLEGKNKPLLQIIIMLGVLGTGSRGTVIMVAASYIYYFAIIEKKVRQVLVVSVFISFIILMFYMQIIPNRFFGEQKDGSIENRKELMYLAKNIISKEYINGVGYGQFQVNFWRHIPAENIGETNFEIVIKEDKMVTHNDYLKIMVELGVAAFLYFIYIALVQLYKGKNIDKIYSSLSIFTVAILVFSLTHNNMNTFIFWTLLFSPTLFRRNQLC